MTPTSAPSRRLIGWFIGTTIFTFTVLMHVTFPNLGGAGLRLPFNAAVWMGFGVMMALAMWPAARGTIRYSRFHIGLGFLLLALWLPFLWSWNEASLIALPRMLTVTAGAILLLGIAQLQLTKRDWWWIGFAILLGALLETALSYVQLYWLEPGNWLGYNVESHRPYGIFQQKNVLASFLATGLAVSAWLIGDAWSRWQRAIAILAPLFIPAILWFCGSVTGWLATVIITPMLLIHLWGHNRRVFKLWGGALLAGIGVALLLWYTTFSGMPRSAESMATTSGYRWYVYTHCLRMIAENPFLGWGYGRFQHDFLYSFADWRAAQPINQPEIVEPYIVETFSHPHNELLLWGVEGGLLPMLAILCFGVWMIWRLFAHGPRGERLILASLLLPLTLHSMTEYPFYHSQAHWLAFLLILALTTNRCWQKKTSENRYTFGIRMGNWIAMPMLLIFMTTHIQTLWKTTKFLESSGQKTNEMLEIKNPLGIHSTLESLLMSQQLINGQDLESERVANNYINWAENFFKKHPNPTILSNIIQAGKITEENFRTSMEIELNHLFPHLNEKR